MHLEPLTIKLDKLLGAVLFRLPVKDFHARLQKSTVRRILYLGLDRRRLSIALLSKVILLRFHQRRDMMLQQHYFLSHYTLTTLSDSSLHNQVL